MASSRILNTTHSSNGQRSTLRLNASVERREERRARSTVDLVVQWEQHDQHRLLLRAGEEEKGGVVVMRGGGSGSGGGDVSSRRQVWRVHAGGTSDGGGGQWETLRGLEEKLGQVGD